MALRRNSLIVIETLASPAAATDFIWQVPAGQRWIFQAIHLSFTTSATAGTRRIRFRIESNTDGLVEFWHSASFTTTVISTVFVVTLAPTNQNEVVFDDLNIARMLIPTIEFENPGGVRSLFTFIAGDQITNLRAYVKKL